MLGFVHWEMVREALLILLASLGGRFCLGGMWPRHLRCLMALGEDAESTEAGLFPSRRVIHVVDYRRET